MGGEGRKERGGEGGKGKDDLHPTLFLGPAVSSYYTAILIRQNVIVLHYFLSLRRQFTTNISTRGIL